MLTPIPTKYVCNNCAGEKAGTPYKDHDCTGTPLGGMICHCPCNNFSKKKGTPLMPDGREAFEKWAKEQCLNLPRHDDQYVYTDAHYAWLGWQSALEAACKAQCAECAAGHSVQRAAGRFYTADTEAFVHTWKEETTGYERWSLCKVQAIRALMETKPQSKTNPQS